MDKHFNALSPAELERLALLGEEMCEAGQIIGKILRHGYESYDPTDENAVVNRALLQKELGHVKAAIRLMSRAEDIDLREVEWHQTHKLESVKQWLHHQPSHVVDRAKESG